MGHLFPVSKLWFRKWCLGECRIFSRKKHRGLDFVFVWWHVLKWIVLTFTQTCVYIVYIFIVSHQASIDVASNKNVIVTTNLLWGDVTCYFLLPIWRGMYFFRKPFFFACRSKPTVGFLLTKRLFCKFSERWSRYILGDFLDLLLNKEMELSNISNLTKKMSFKWGRGGPFKNQGVVPTSYEWSHKHYKCLINWQLGLCHPPLFME